MPSASKVALYNSDEQAKSDIEAGNRPTSLVPPVSPASGPRPFPTRLSNDPRQQFGGSSACLHSGNIDSWPTTSNGEFHRAEVEAFVGAITAHGDVLDSTLLTPTQAFLLMRLYRQAATLTETGAKHTSQGRLAELVASIFSAATPVLVGLQTQFSKEDSSTLYWLLNLTVMGLSLGSTIAVAIERTNNLKTKGLAQQISGADQLLELKRFLAGATPYGADYRKCFELLSVRLADMQHATSSKIHAINSTPDCVQQQHQLASPPNLSPTAGKLQSPCTPLNVNNPKLVLGSPDLEIHSAVDNGDASSAKDANNLTVVLPGSPDLAMHSTGTVDDSTVDDGDASSAKAIASDMGVDIDEINDAAKAADGVEEDQVEDAANGDEM